MKKKSSFIELSRFQFYLMLQTLFIGMVLLYQLIWFIYGKNIMADCIVSGRLNELQNSGTILYKFAIADQTYNDYDTRNEATIINNQIEIVYLSFYPRLSRINRFYNNWLGFIIMYGLFCAFTSALFLIPQETIPANTYFYFTKKKPWVNIIEK
jgi:hypothetical protein